MPDTKREQVLSVRDLDITFKTTAGPVHAIRGVNIDLYKGETVALVGESGSGKSVTMKAAMGILAQNAKVNSGSIRFSYHHADGSPETVDLLQKDKKWIRRHINGKRIAMVFQDPMTSLDPTMTIGKQIMEGMLWHFKMPKAEAYQKALKLLEEVGITDAEKRMKSYPHQLSGGMRQRVVIAIALSCDPDLLICDEPTTALDDDDVAGQMDLCGDHVAQQRDQDVGADQHEGEGCAHAQCAGDCRGNCQAGAGAQDQTQNGVLFDDAVGKDAYLGLLFLCHFLPTSFMPARCSS